MNVQKKLAADILKCSVKKVRIDTSRLEDVKESITKKDIRSLIKDGAIQRVRTQEQSRSRSRKTAAQKHRGKRKGAGSKKGTINSSISRKTRWILKIRAQRNLLKELKESKKIDNKLFTDLYRKSKGGFFRSRRHIMIYLEEHDLIKNDKQ